MLEEKKKRNGKKTRKGGRTREKQDKIRVQKETRKKKGRK